MPSSKIEPTGVPAMENRIGMTLATMHVTAAMVALSGFVLYVMVSKSEVPETWIYGVIALASCLLLTVILEAIAFGLHFRQSWAWIATLAIFVLLGPGSFGAILAIESLRSDLRQPLPPAGEIEHQPGPEGGVTEPPASPAHASPVDMGEPSTDFRAIGTWGFVFIPMMFVLLALMGLPGLFSPESRAEFRAGRRLGSSSY